MGANTWPPSFADRVAFIEQRLDAWSENSDTLGLSEDEIGELTNLLTPARNTLDAAHAARSAAKSATSSFYAAAEPFSVYAAALNQKIRSTAKTSGESEIYAIAQI